MHVGGIVAMEFGVRSVKFHSIPILIVVVYPKFMLLVSSLLWFAGAILVTVT